MDQLNRSRIVRRWELPPLPDLTYIKRAHVAPKMTGEPLQRQRPAIVLDPLPELVVPAQRRPDLPPKVARPTAGTVPVAREDQSTVHLPSSPAASFSAIEADLTGVFDVDAQPEFDHGPIARVARAAIEALQTLALKYNTTEVANSAVDLVIAEAGGRQLLVLDADRMHPIAIAEAIRRHGDGNQPGGTVRDASRTLALSYSSTLSMFASSTNPVPGSRVHLTLGAPRRTAAVLRDEDGLERLTIRTTATITATHDPSLMTVSEAADLLSNLRSALDPMQRA
jgi:hypothetical protein